MDKAKLDELIASLRVSATPIARSALEDAAADHARQILAHVNWGVDFGTSGLASSVVAIQDSDGTYYTNSAASNSPYQITPQSIQDAIATLPRRNSVNIWLRQVAGVTKWQKLGLMLYDAELGAYLVWKHVACPCHEMAAPGTWYGNLGYPYAIGAPFQNRGMCTAGPAGSLVDVRRRFVATAEKSHHALDYWTADDTQPHVMAIWCTDLVNLSTLYWPKNPSPMGVYGAYAGIPVAVYSATMVGEDWDLRLVEGDDVLPLICREEEES